MTSDPVEPAGRGALLVAWLATLVALAVNMTVAVQSWWQEAGADGMQRIEIVSWFYTIGVGLSVTAFAGLVLLLSRYTRGIGFGLLAGLALAVLGDLVWVYIDAFSRMS
jgi:hypothetical protein